ncbi:hypothetical protein PGUG_02016 [Meyerozyma guilliermondii ATCC 6260]|uniref:Uncharacterized protein n=1 Tax=Meyerozyma guilliermondii (strain ATCC 6260 / CBS 566 / DSM 6381 / JCM 1539 / NBRC 10279 / NRRL Y-324) TaxID=294746 RepID=A5DFG5_PICGU|nr:uncharacterized protein PGUG_02016 [Meyerozyma guilliermondii ATCC 6260]EDK37918.2 hypothetical protein PGUG_02016 [Meyerozyma guilliermondii ATCC 6260]
MAIVSDGASVVPGQYLAPLRDPQGHYISGPGTTITKVEVEDQAISVISATLVGSVKVVRDENEPKDDTDEQKSPAYVISVAPRKELPSVLPKQGDVVLVRITRLNQKQAFCEILSVEDNKNVLSDSGIGAVGTTAHQSVAVSGGASALTSQAAVASFQSTLGKAVAADLGETFKGIIRTQDVRLTDRDRVQIVDCFRPGDIVRGMISSLGDGSNYYLTTARNDLGVVFARGEGGAGGILYPLDWETMVDSTTGRIEKRKCAKPFKSN